MTSKFVVTETNFEYNDEVHSVGECEGGTPVAVFDTKQEADDYARERIISEFLQGWAGSNLASFGYKVSSIFDAKPDFIAMDEDDFFDMSEHWYDLDKAIDIKSRSRAELEDIANKLSFRPYFVTEVK